MPHKKGHTYDEHMKLDIGDPLMNAGLGGAMKRPSTVQGVKVKKIPPGKRAMTEKSWKKAKERSRTGKTYGYGGGGY